MADALSVRLSTDVTARQVRRLRDEGLTFPSERRFPGRGSETLISDRDVESAAAALTAFRRRRHGGRAALDLLASGQPVQAKALVAYFDELERSIMEADERAGKRIAGEDAHPLDQAWFATQETLAALLRTPEGRRWRKRLRQRRRKLLSEELEAESVDSALKGAVASVYAIALTGEASSPDSLDELLAAAGAYALRDDRAFGESIVRELDLEKIQRDLQMVRLAALRDAIADVSPDELLRAHDDARFIGRVAIAATAVGQMLFPTSDIAGLGPIASAAEREPGMFVVLMVLLRRQLGPVIDEWRNEIAPELAQLEAQAVVAGRLPSHLAPYMTPGLGAARLAALPDVQRDAIQAEFRKIVEELPPDVRAQAGYNPPP